MFLMSSQPIPPAPTTRTREFCTFWKRSSPRIALAESYRDMTPSRELEKEREREKNPASGVKTRSIRPPVALLQLAPPLCKLFLGLG